MSAPVERWDELRAYLRELADLMGLKDWDVRVDPDTPPDQNHIAEVAMPFGRRVAIVRASDVFWSSDPDDQRETCVHELVHCHIEAINGPPRDDLREYIGVVADHLFWKQFHRAMEFTTDNIAVAWARSLPMPPWARRKRARGSA